ncbi:MAG: FeoA family protein [Rhodoferax sp.]|nr:FeoA family protein [Rhodoferax sp.]
MTIKNKLTLADLEVGDHAVIKGFSDVPMSLKLLEMGLIPETKIEVESLAPLGCPVNIKIGDYMLSLRKSEAATVKISI